MIENNNKSIPVAAPQFQNLNAILVKYHTFAGNSVYSLTELITFLTTPSVSRSEFVATLTEQIVDVDHKYITQKYS